LDVQWLSTNSNKLCQNFPVEIRDNDSTNQINFVYESKDGIDVMLLAQGNSALFLERLQKINKFYLA
jgi:hypothetical protein